MLLLPLLDPLIQRAFSEDLAGGDLSAEACVDPTTRASAKAVAKKPLVVCGGPVFARVFQLLDPAVSTELLVDEGTQVAPGTVLLRVTGLARSLLMAERTALNFMQRLSGTATMARACVDALAPGSRTRIADTRKTTPGLRLLERYAVRTGGAHNHRDQLGSAVMIKDNHIVASGGIRRAVERARAYAPHTSRVEVEVKTMTELDEAIAVGADIIMLDNFDDAATEAAVKHTRAKAPSVLIEASGGITSERIRRLSQIGVDVISIGALTHSAPAADISLDFELAE